MRTVSIRVDDRAYDVAADTSIAAALLSLPETDDVPNVRIFCGMGSCQACLVTVDGVRGVRACITPVRDDLSIERTETSW